MMYKVTTSVVFVVMLWQQSQIAWSFTTTTKTTANNEEKKIAWKSHHTKSTLLHMSTETPKSTKTTKTTTEQAVEKLKKVLEREYISFFDPMQREYYSSNVSFDDPMTSLSGVDAYQTNVDMLSSRTLLGKFLFQDAAIALHSITGGDVIRTEDGENNGSTSTTTTRISNIITRWTLRVTAKVLPWKPTARFSGISVYEVSPGGTEGVIINHQTDYWDSINIKEGGEYGPVDKSIAVKDFLDQIKPDNGNAAAAGPEVPYQLLRRGNGYEIRRYPAHSVAKIPYERRDEGYDVLASLTKGMDPLAPAIIEVPNDDTQTKTMSWPLTYALPGAASIPPVNKSILERIQQPLWKGCEIINVPSRVVAVGRYSDASVAPIVRKVDRQLRESCQRDGISIPTSTSSCVQFAQYDAIFTLGKRRGEVWIELEDDDHPW